MNITNEKIIKLEIKQIAAYLPYRLKYLDKDTNELTTMRSISTEINLIDMGWGNAHDLKEFKPILRPLSDLTKDIEEGKPMFFPSHQLIKHIEKEQDIFNCSYSEIDYLIRNHFDLFGLIDAGLAIDINTL